MAVLRTMGFGMVDKTQTTLILGLALFLSACDSQPDATDKALYVCHAQDKDTATLTWVADKSDGVYGGYHLKKVECK